MVPISTEMLKVKCRIHFDTFFFFYHINGILFPECKSDHEILLVQWVLITSNQQSKLLSISIKAFPAPIYFSQPFLLPLGIRQAVIQSFYFSLPPNTACSPKLLGLANGLSLITPSLSIHVHFVESYSTAKSQFINILLCDLYPHTLTFTPAP